MSQFDDLDADLESQIDRLFKQFIEQYFPANPEHVPATYHHHVKAFCILAHAAFEEFVEQISLRVMVEAIARWQADRTVTSPLLALLLFYKANIGCVENEEDDQPRHFDSIRIEVDGVKRKHSIAIVNNHGFSLKYLRSILTPIAIDISTDPSLSSSLQTLADARGSYAHGIAELGEFTDKSKAKHPMTPEKARDVVNDCLRLCKDVSASARRLLSL